MKKTAAKALGRRTANLQTKPAVVPEFLQFALEFGEVEMLADLSSLS
jgi:hypothetical protein